LKISSLYPRELSGLSAAVEQRRTDSVDATVNDRLRNFVKDN